MHAQHWSHEFGKTLCFNRLYFMVVKITLPGHYKYPLPINPALLWFFCYSYNFMWFCFLAYRLAWNFLLLFTILLVVNPIQKHPSSFIVLECRTKALHETVIHNTVILGMPYLPDIMNTQIAFCWFSSILMIFFHDHNMSYFNPQSKEKKEV